MDGFVSWAKTVDWQAWAMFVQALAIAWGAWLAKQSIATLREQARAQKIENARERVLGLAHQIELEFQKLCIEIPPAEYSFGPGGGRAGYIQSSFGIIASLVRSNWVTTISQGRIYFGEDIAKHFDEFVSDAYRLGRLAHQVAGDMEKFPDQVPGEIRTAVAGRREEFDQATSKDGILALVKSRISQIDTLVR